MRDTQIQLAAAALVLIVIGGLVGAYAAERLLAGRRRKDPTGAEPPTPDPDPTGAVAADPATVRFAPVARPNGKPVPVNGSDVPVPQQVRSPR